MRKSAGFTFIELTIVVIVIGILVTLAIPQYARSVEVALCSNAMTTIQQMRKAALVFQMENKTFTGIDQVTLGNLVGANFADTPEWDYTAAPAGGGGFSINATRLGGPWDTLSIIITDRGDFSLSSTYPYDTPGAY